MGPNFAHIESPNLNVAQLTSLSSFHRRQCYVYGSQTYNKAVFDVTIPGYIYSESNFKRFK